MHVFFSGIGGTGIGALALIAKKAGYEVSGSDKQDGGYVQHLREQGVTDISIGQTKESIERLHQENPIDWFVYSSAVPKENPNHPELLFVQSNNIKNTKRDEFLSKLLSDTGQKMIAVAGTHGKTTTTAMMIWLAKQLNIPVSYSVGAKLGFGDMGEFNPDAEYFIYEADEYDRNFLAFSPHITLITGVSWDHPDIYPTQDDYNQAFREFVGKSKWTIAHPADLERLNIKPDWHIFSPNPATLSEDRFTLAGAVNRQNSQLVVQAMAEMVDPDNADPDLLNQLLVHSNQFPGVSRRFEKIADNVYSDYAHTPEKIQGALQIAKEISGKGKIVVIYEGLHNTRQHFIKDQLKTLFQGANKLCIVPSYLAREDKGLEMLAPEKLCQMIQSPTDCHPSQLDDNLREFISQQSGEGNLVLALSAGGGGSLDEWLRQQFSNN